MTDMKNSEFRREAYMSEYPIYTEEGNLFCKCRNDGDGNAILVGKNGQIPFRQLASRIYHPESTGMVREKRTTAYKCHKVS